MHETIKMAPECNSKKKKSTVAYAPMGGESLNFSGKSPLLKNPNEKVIFATFFKKGWLRSHEIMVTITMRHLKRRRRIGCRREKVMAGNLREGAASCN